MTRYPKCAFLVALNRRLKVLRSVVRAEALLGEDYSRHSAEQDRVTGSTECDRELTHWASVASGVTLTSIGCILGMENVELLPRSKFLRCGDVESRKNLASFDRFLKRRTSGVIVIASALLKSLGVVSSRTCGTS